MYSDIRVYPSNNLFGLVFVFAQFSITSVLTLYLPQLRTLHTLLKKLTEDIDRMFKI